jgi:hypothetical protein
MSFAREDFRGNHIKDSSVRWVFIIPTYLCRMVGIQILARHPREVFPTERTSNEENEEMPRQMDMDECIV